jgi:hypothetical protein
MSQQRRPNPESGLGGLGGVLMGATRAGQNVNRNLARPRYTPAPQPQPRPQPQAHRQARLQAQPQCYVSPTANFNFRLSLLTSQRIPVNLPRKRR